MSDNATHIVTITGYNSDGEGVARLENGRVVFVRGAARDDVLEVSLVKERSGVARAEIVRILTSSPYRKEADCAFYPECGGCDYRHISYEEELFAKLQCVNDALKRIGGLATQVNQGAQVEQILHTGQINGYRIEPLTTKVTRFLVRRAVAPVLESYKLSPSVTSGSPGPSSVF